MSILRRRATQSLGKRAIYTWTLAWGPWERAFLSRFTNSRCAAYRLFLDTYFDNLANLTAAEPGFPLVNLERNCSFPGSPG
ncbi:MAG: hypothetical protein DSZ23_01765 [Thermodesulfatator sp.]|nr:MAG: hypothetical protein DSZ23_01765 [Thermodesulfatator sp.]